MYNRKIRQSIDNEFDTVHNYYEHIVFDHLLALAKEQSFDMALIPDMACVALNHLPPRYIRHDVDMAFYLSPNEYEEIENKVVKATTEAIAFVMEREDQSDAGS